METHRRRPPFLPVVVLFALILSACVSVAPFSERAYEQAISLKVESLALMGMAEEPFGTHEGEVRRLMLEARKAYEFAKGRPGNTMSARQWEILMSPDRNLLGGYLRRWEEESVLSRTFIDEARGLVSDAFDTIVGLESGKVKPSQVK